MDMHLIILGLSRIDREKQFAHFSLHLSIQRRPGWLRPLSKLRRLITDQEEFWGAVPLAIGALSCTLLIRVLDASHSVEENLQENLRHETEGFRSAAAMASQLALYVTTPLPQVESRRIRAGDAASCPH